MTENAQTLVEIGLINEDMAALLESCFQNWTSLYFCGGTGQGFHNCLSRVLSLQLRERSLMLLSTQVQVPWLPVTVQPFQDDSLSGSQFVRSCLRQDPDCLILDGRAPEAADLLLQAKLTGHRVVAHLPTTVQLATVSFVESAARGLDMQPDFVRELLAGDVFLELGDGDQASLKEVWQMARDDQGKFALVRLFQLGPTGWEGELASPLSPPEAPPTAHSEPLHLPDEWGPRQEPFLNSLRRHLGRHQRLAWGPVFSAHPPECRDSHFGGLPLLAQGESWPRCGACQQRMLLVVQIQLAQAPEPLQERLGCQGVFQFFYCISGHCTEPEAWAPFRSNSLARCLSGPLVDPAPDDRLDSPEARHFKASCVASWEAVQDYPGGEERGPLWPEGEPFWGGWADQLESMARGGEAGEHLQSVYSKYLEYFQLSKTDLGEAAGYFSTAPGDKLLGWPFWSQAADYPGCPECSQPMEMILQINNDGFTGGAVAAGSHFGQLFAGDGNGHVFRCSRHGQMTFCWACG